MLRSSVVGSCVVALATLACTSTTSEPDFPPGRLLFVPVPSPTTLAGGSGNTCVLRDGEVWCWGANVDGELGDGTRINRLHPTRVVGLNEVVSIAPGWWHGCALIHDGSVWCWGGDDDLFGTQVETVSASPIQMVGLADIVQLDSMGGSCALRSDGAVLCWGTNYHGKLGDGTTDDHSQPVEVRGLDDAVEVTVGFFHACARRRHGAVVCWGSNDQGQLLDVAAPEYGPVAIAGLTDVVEIDSGGNHVCARRSNGRVSCWGDNSHGQLGIGEIDEDPLSSPTTGVHEVVGLRDVVELDANGDHSCARVETGDVLCWGSNDDGELGDGTFDDRSSPVVVEGLADVIALGLGLSHSCARQRDGQLMCWGFGGHGELGDGLPSAAPPRRPVAETAGAVELALASNHACARWPDGRVRCWGDNDSGQLGDGTREAHTGLVEVAELVEVEQISAGSVHTCARRGDGSVACWGDDTTQRRTRDCRPIDGGHAMVIVDGEPDPSHYAPAIVGGLAEVIDIHADDNQTCALGRGGEIWCWASDAETAELLDTVPNAVAVAGDCVRTADERALCWDRGQSAPATDVGVERVVELVAGGGHHCALQASGRVQCWGQNRAGQLGDGTTLARSEPVTAIGLENAVELSAGHDRTCARVADGSVWCWGDNTANSAGSALSSDLLVPTRVEALSGVVEIDTGHLTTCVRLGSGDVECWGDALASSDDEDAFEHRRATPGLVEGL